MKRIILVAVILLAASVDMQAQMVKFGIKGGLNYANQTGNDITIIIITRKPLPVIMLV